MIMNCLLKGKATVSNSHSFPFAFRPGSTSGRSVILLPQNHPDDEDQSRDDANLNSEISDPFPAFHLPFAFGRSTRTSRNSSGPVVRRRPRWARSSGGAEGSAILSITFAASS
jgi:hypothetical protein